jgi:hypothetical protein
MSGDAEPIFGRKSPYFPDFLTKFQGAGSPLHERKGLEAV